MDSDPLGCIRGARRCLQVRFCDGNSGTSCGHVAGFVTRFLLAIVVVTFPFRSCFRTLIGLGSVVDPVTDDLGWTPLHCAVSMGFLDVSMCLVEAGARLDARDCVDNSPIQLASDVSPPLRPMI